MISTQEMRRLEDQSEQKGVSKLKLMENAGYGLFQALKEKNNFLIFCGSGNNGGDGFVLARYLKIAEKEVHVVFLGKESKMKKEAAYNYKMLQTLYRDIFVQDYDIKKYDILVDAMLGTGTQGAIREPYASAINDINNAKKEIIAVDIPTGLDPDSGDVLDIMVKPTKIFTFHDLKTGLKKFKDITEIIDIGILTKDTVV